MSKISILNNVTVLSNTHPDFPQKLKFLSDPPEVLFAIGNTKILNDLSIAIVGSRKCTPYGKEIAYKFANEISNNNIRIISGLAEGIDTYAHKGSISNKTIAVLGSGFNKIYPKSNINLIYEIIQNDGVVISEYFFDVNAYPFNFPKRNRIVAALAEGIVVVEAGENSGALITANIAKKLNKKIYVIPSNIDNIFSKGSNNLLYDNNVKITLSTQDILSDFIDNSLATYSISINIPNEYLDIYNILKTNSLSADEIARKLNTSIMQVNSTLTMMELNEYIYKSSDGNFKIKNVR